MAEVKAQVSPVNGQENGETPNVNAADNGEINNADVAAKGEVADNAGVDDVDVADDGEVANNAWKKKGYVIEWIKKSKGNKPIAGQSVTVHCTGYGKNGDLKSIFWTTRKDMGAKKDEPFTFKIGCGNVIKGWDEGVMNLPLGSRAKIKCSPDCMLNIFYLW